MKNWRDVYKGKAVSAAEAVSHIRSGNRVVVGHATGSPEVLLKAMVENREAYKNVELVHMVSMGASEYCLPGMEKHFVHNSLFAGATTRKAIHDGRALFTASHFSQIPRLFTEKILPVDVTLCMVSTPDEHGFCSFGISVDYTKPAAESSKLVIAEVTPHMPRTLGDAFIHVSDIDYIVECDSKPLVMNPPKITDIDEKIGSSCAELIRDGDCLQLGIGAMPDAILGFLTHKKDLGIHTEMFSDGVVDLVEAGVVTCARKNFHPGKMVATFFMGTEKLYKFVHNNPMVQMFPVNITNNPAIIAQNDNMVSINSTLQVDLTGQAVSETIGYKQFSATGGQADFVRGAAWSKGGRSILAFHATASGGKISRIVPHVDVGAVVTTTRTDIHYAVTEYGIADLRGKSVPERAKALINIAHPDFRTDLKKEFQRIYNRKA
ncbi:MAG TPA: acetyl-CoA hydrolase/transferase C-terminal domain-containing protein [Deltaproteobacteria bacterium]|nr:acetyl-CoA hydrolase/transferase family protein [Deltaproteobacteria bacterium]OQC28241.1 MAG: Succinyl-CoA:coenzyme A transferase [Deltaproteobacteria bacterium ADurb.Bin072]HRW80071.1 acetyl-CoA hydrolase/transferase C-terminal domain-containing protein [Desulfomonilia bacterium]HNQ86375.1 acetyl-CoA hydrolase/transferase C-terminal domain-containing protein [Deltaproteobacteria bacterium]HOA44669.1 acetyl-CoA hydrolase/transferase C-terminal domain-containing protein [Deltaproteobacteria 